MIHVPVNEGRRSQMRENCRQSVMNYQKKQNVDNFSTTKSVESKTENAESFEQKNETLSMIFFAVLVASFSVP